MYIAKTKKKYKDKYHEQILLRESYREDKKVKTRTILNLTNKPKAQVEAIIAALKAVKEKNTIVTSNNQSQGKSIGFSSVILFLMKMLGVLKSIGSSYEAKIATILIASRVVSQGSRLQTLTWAKEEDKILDLLDFTKDDRDKLNSKTIYHGLDYMYLNHEKIEDKLFKLYYKDNPPKRVYYDVTSSYVEGDYCDSELVAYGYNRDGKKGKQQIVVGLLTDENGHAISIHTYPGNTNDVKTFTDQLDKLKNRFNLEHITIIGDGGMIKSEDIIKIKELGYDYITSIGKPSIKKLIDNKESKMQMSLFDEDLKEIIENDTRYILRQNPIRRDEIRKNRDNKIKTLKEYIKQKQDYYNSHYRAKKETLENYISNKISSLQLSSFISYEIIYKEEQIVVKNSKDEEKTKTKDIASIEVIIDEEAKKEVQMLDGCYVIKTSLTNTGKYSKDEIHKAYKTLIKVENAFKTLKTDYLEIRPLYLKTDDRIKGHVALSMIAYNIVLKLKEYIKLADIDFKSTISQLSKVQTVINNINNTISFETIPLVNDRLRVLFDKMGFKLPTKI